jgi:hypothetical protein
VVAQLGAKVGLGSDQVGVAAQLGALLFLHPPPQMRQARRAVVHQATGGLPPHPQAVIVHLTGQLQQLAARVEAGRQLLEEPLAAFPAGYLLCPGIQHVVLDLDAVALVAVDQQGAHVGEMAGQLMQHQRLELAGGGGELVGVGVVHPHGELTVRAGSGVVDDAGSPTHRWPPYCGKGRSGGDGARVGSTLRLPPRQAGPACGLSAA